MARVTLGLTTRVGRRIATLFLLSALVPILVVAVLGYRQVRGQLLEDSRTQLQQNAKSLGMNLLDQLHESRGALHELPADSQAQVPALSDRQAAAVRAGRIVLALGGGEPVTVWLAGPGTRGLQWTRLDADSLLAGARAQAGVGDDDLVCVRESSGTRIISCDPGAGATEQVTAAWELFLSYDFEGAPWHVDVSRPRAAVLAPILAFRRTFFASVIALLGIVIAVATFQVRRSLQPLHELTEATSRLAHRDFSAPVRVTSNDEFESLADSFNAMATDLDAQFKSNADLIARLDDLSYGALAALARTIDASSPWTAGHSERVTALSLRMAQRLGLPQEKLDALRRGGLLHDIGKIGLPPEILDKPGRLEPQEFARVRQHPALGAKILAPLQAFADAIPIVLHHHERWDGTGYPDQLRAEEIPLPARLLSVADVYDALVSDRPYRDGYSHEFALETIRASSGSQFDPAMVNLFMAVISTPQADEPLVGAGA